MRLHLALAFSSLLSMGLLVSSAHADGSDCAKTTEGTGTPVRAAKASARFSTQVQLFTEQKEAPVASKTSLATNGAPRLSQKSKD